MIQRSSAMTYGACYLKCAGRALSGVVLLAAVAVAWIREHRYYFDVINRFLLSYRLHCSVAYMFHIAEPPPSPFTNGSASASTSKVSMSITNIY